MAKLFTYIAENESFSEAKIFELDQSDQATGLLDMIGPPQKVPPDPPSLSLRTGEDPETPSVDQILHSYIGVGNVLRFIKGDIVTQPANLGLTSDVCYYTELNDSYEPAGGPGTSNVILKYGNNTVATNPHGIAQRVEVVTDDGPPATVTLVVGETLYISDYDSTKIWLLGYEDLATPETDNQDNPFVTVSGIDVQSVLPEVNPAEYQYHGNGIMAIQDKSNGTWYLFALFIVSSNAPTQQADPEPPAPYLESQLVRIKLPYASVADLAVVSVGRNAVDMDEVDGNILITAIGGPQKEDDTNEIFSMITKVENLFTTLDTTPLLIGDVAPYGDFRCLAVGDDGYVNILTGYFGAGYTGFNWAVYRVHKDVLLEQHDLSLSDAVDDEILKDIGHDTCTPGFFWGIMAGGGRLILIRGSEMVITDETEPYLNESEPGMNVIFGRGPVSEGGIGGANMNSLNFTWATEWLLSQQQQLTGEGLLRHRRHHQRHHHIRHLAMQAMQAALAARVADGASEESGGN
jgi:hypothetical protein